MSVVVNRPGSRRPPTPQVKSTRSDTMTKVTPITEARRKKASRSPTPGSQGNGKVAVLPILPNSAEKPLWLRSLLKLQWTSSIATFVLLGVTLSIYGGTVYVQKRWSEEYQKLENLRRAEQQFSATNEVLKHQIANTGASASSGLKSQTPADLLFVTPSSSRLSSPDAGVSPPEMEPVEKLIDHSPLGY
ncbi:MAG: hypothetical protein RLZZ338_535 [Cyanobacteriota bacterium]